MSEPKTLTKAEATELTQQLKNKTQTLAKLITKAHDEKVWIPLGYSSFTAWADAELPFTYARAFQLLNIGVLTQQLHEVAKLPEDYVLTDRNAREISTYGRALFVDALKDEAEEDPARNTSTIQRLLFEKPQVAKQPEGDNEEAEDEKPQRNTERRLSGGEKLSQTQNVHILYRHIEDFPRARNLDSATREQGISVLLQAQSNVQKILDEARDKNQRYEAHVKDNS